MSQSVELTTEECLALLETRSVGRIAFNGPVGPQVLPVSHAVVHDKVVFRTLPYGVIANSVNGAACAFEIDELDEQLRRGWSVLAVGTVHRVEDPRDVRVVKEHWDPEPWVDGQRNLYFRLDWVDLTGRRVGPPT